MGNNPVPTLGKLFFVYLFSFRIIKEIIYKVYCVLRSILLLRSFFVPLDTQKYESKLFLTRHYPFILTCLPRTWLSQFDPLRIFPDKPKNRHKKTQKSLFLQGIKIHILPWKIYFQNIGRCPLYHSLSVSYRKDLKHQSKSLLQVPLPLSLEGRRRYNSLWLYCIKPHREGPGVVPVCHIRSV